MPVCGQSGAVRNECCRGPNGQVAFGHYSWRAEDNAFARHAITVLALRRTQIVGITSFRSPEAFTGFQLPDQIVP
jgi:hypothetical protein